MATGSKHALEAEVKTLRKRAHDAEFQCEVWKGAAGAAGAMVDQLAELGDGLVDAVEGLDSYAAMGGAPIERSERAFAAVEAWRAARTP